MKAAATLRRRVTRPRAFTIVELLTTIGVIVLLIGLLAPALSSARASGRKARCQGNLKQMAAAAHAYAAIYDAFPVAVRYDNSAGSFRNISWDWVTRFDGTVIAPGALWGFVNNPGETLRCPDHEPSSTIGHDVFTGYNYNTTYVGGEALFPNVGWGSVRAGVAPHACDRGERCAMFGDGGWKNGPNRFMRAPLNSERLGLNVMYAGTQAFRHRGSTSIAFVDGHVGATQQIHRGAFATDALLNTYASFPRNGFLSDDDAMYDPR